MGKKLRTEPTTGNSRVWHEGPCGDCGEPVDTRANGGAFHHSQMTTSKGGSIFLVCAPDIVKRDSRGEILWAPGSKHNGDAILAKSA